MLSNFNVPIYEWKSVAIVYEYTLYTITDVALVGGGSYTQLGEISLSHNGVLFLDELPYF